MPIPSPSEYADSSLPVALDGQLHWVQRPILAFSATTSSDVISGDDSPPSVWWPSILFNNYADFEFFFPNEFQPRDDNDDDDDDVAETKKFILSRILVNMRRKRPVMVARLLGRPLKEYVEIVAIPFPVTEKTQEVQVHEATQYVEFTRLARKFYISQMKPQAFTVPSNNNMTLDEDLYMSYMFALDLAATKRIGGPNAPHDTLRSEFRDIGLKEIHKISFPVSTRPETYEEASIPVDNDGFSFSNADEIVHQNQVEDPLNRLSPETPLTKTAPTVDSASYCTYVERVSNREYAQNRRGSVVSNESMCPGGSLSVRRLDPGLDHIPIEARPNSRNKPKLRCAMHRWLGDRKEGNLGHCRTCNVNLCTDCYYLFHTIDGTDKIREEFSRRKQIQATCRLKRKQKRKENSTLTDDKQYPYPKNESTCSDKSLRNDGLTMSLANRNNLSQYRHIPIAPRRHAHCAMHRWLGFRKQGNLCFCPDCNITLCRMCYDDFHKTKNIVEIKYWLQQEYTKREEQKEQKMF